MPEQAYKDEGEEENRPSLAKLHAQGKFFFQQDGRIRNHIRDSTASVSYTHLDVYKRQHPTRKVGAFFLFCFQVDFRSGDGGEGNTPVLFIFPGAFSVSH